MPHVTISTNFNSTSLEEICVSEPNMYKMSNKYEECCALDPLCPKSSTPHQSMKITDTNLNKPKISWYPVSHHEINNIPWNQISGQKMFRFTISMTETHEQKTLQIHTSKHNGRIACKASFISGITAFKY